MIVICEFPFHNSEWSFADETERKGLRYANINVGKRKRTIRKLLIVSKITLVQKHTNVRC